MEYYMNLHEHQDDFSELIHLTARKLHVPYHFVEKDYWITYILSNLAKSPYAHNFIFKGGTALSKAYRVISRFSEDIDLAVILEGVTGNQQKKIIDTTSKAITKNLVEIYKDGVTSKGSRFRRTVHKYPKIFLKKEEDQTGEDIIIEINSFIQPKGFSNVSITSYIAEFLKNTNQEAFIENYGLESFKIQVLGMKRTFTEKILSLVRASYMEQPMYQLQERVRHFYDLHMLLETQEIIEFVNSEEFIKELLQTKKDDASNKDFYGSWVEKPLQEAPIFRDYNLFWKELEKTYNGIFKTLVYGSLPPSSSIYETMMKIISRVNSTTNI